MNANFTIGKCYWRKHKNVAAKIKKTNGQQASAVADKAKRLFEKASAAAIDEKMLSGIASAAADDTKRLSWRDARGFYFQQVG